MSNKLAKNCELLTINSGSGDKRIPKKCSEQKACISKSLTKLNGISCRRNQVSQHNRLKTNIYKKIQPPNTNLTTPECGRSISLIDLTPIRNEEAKDKRLQPAEMAVRQGDCKLEKTVFAARRICQVFILNAWRRKRSAFLQQELTANQMETQIDNLNRQVNVLRNLLESEKIRVSRTTGEFQQLVMKMEKTNLEKQRYKTERDHGRAELRKRDEQAADAGIKLQNMKNDYLTSRDEVRRLENQLQKEHKELVGIRDEKRRLVEKVSCSGESLRAFQGTVQILQHENLQLETQLEGARHSSKEQLFVQDNTTRKLNEMEVHQMELLQEIQSLRSVGGNLENKIQLLEEELAKKAVYSEEVAGTLQAQQLELMELRKRSAEFSDLHNSWSSRVLRAASTFVSFPFSILYGSSVVFVPFSRTSI